MASSANEIRLSFLAGADLRTKQYHFVKTDSAGKVVLAGAGEAAIGVVVNKPNTNEEAAVQVLGIAKVIAGGSITTGSRVAVDANGQAKAAVASTTKTDDTGAAADALVGSHAVGILVNTANVAQNQVAEVLLLHLGAVPTTAA